MEDRRSYIRFFSQLKARYTSINSKEGWEECTVINISRKGIAIKFFPSEKINVGSTVHLEIFAATEIKPINVKGVFKWIEKGGNDFVGGIELTEILDDVKFSKLC